MTTSAGDDRIAVAEPRADGWASDRHRRSVLWIVALATAAIVFDGYDLVVYGAVLPTLLADPSALGSIDPATAGALGSYALIGVMVGALLAGAVGDRIGRRRTMLTAIVWFSVGMGATALAPTVGAFGALRFLTGIGVGALVATVGAMIAEFAPADRRNLFNAIVYSGIPAGGVLASLAAIVAEDAIGWRGLFWLGALPLVTLLPLAIVRMPESPRWLLARGRVAEARAVCASTGIPLPEAEVSAPGDRVGFAALARRPLRRPTLLLGSMSFCGLLLTYGLNTWLPQIMSEAGYDAKGSLSFLLVLNGGAIVGGLIASRVADRTGPQRVVAATFCLAALALVVLTSGAPLGILLVAVAGAGIGAIGTQVLIYGFVSGYYPTSSRAAGVAWCAGFGRLGGIGGPLVGGLLLGAGVTSATAFHLFAGVALVGAAVTLTVPRRTTGPVAPTPAGQTRSNTAARP
ncbi:MULTISPECIES: MFS transporter [Nocardiaceae]|uniref:Aromatic acid/H+ symport family MFS transporter n=1 Tax=Rhodococcoides kroppenstedtii TaxID=293050 RepID=A0ABS7NQR9_9NOCA|nr:MULTISPECIES: aromatic acid/H+ symport family MFS transporter [Rhodococcus]AMY18392.1 Gentisate transporter [Rhodococcus sp. PBTS 1]MBY6312352.1 aromatic acid/H+ symport family MFS transporter [Rhodococcus kroppenstedtii]MBY6320336.1 aromatic acid/H+ symport family MFS transporter [Rhodococcus kroppenstedtii]MBY6398643.1 aromatic acid/H+ symport family MFS transporter [Rhodococcus kroppenstedtii]